MKIDIITLGCSKNLVDSEFVGGALAAAGWEVCYDPEVDRGDVLLINTCGFIGDAKQESVDTILAALATKEEWPERKIVVFGCLAGRYMEDLRAELPEVDAFFGVNDLAQIVRYIDRGAPEPDFSLRLPSSPRHWAYLKISEGCDRRCSFCAIPLIRGGHRSRPMEELLEEAQKLVSGGAKELIIIAQDTTYYGLDIYGERRLGALLVELCKIDDLQWIRLHYAYPAQFPEDVIDVLRDEPKMCKYLDVPLQHICDNQLVAMRRSIDREGTESFVARLRAQIPEIALRTTLMVGFPGETRADFEALKEFVARVRFERLGVFAYSQEEGTSAADLEDNIGEVEKAARVEELMALQADISLNLNEKRIGQQMKVVVDSFDGTHYLCRSQWDSPEVDQEILVVSAVPLEPGQFVDVRITDSDIYDLFGEVIENL